MGTKNLKIVITSNHFHPSIGGAQMVTKRLADYFSGRDHSVHVITRKFKGRNQSDFKKYKVWEYHPNDFNTFTKTIKSISPDIILIYSDVFDFFRNILTSDEIKCKILLAPCGSNWAYSNSSFASIFYRNSSRISSFICHSQYDRDFKLCSSVHTKNRCVIIPNGVDLDEFDNNKLDRNALLSQHAEKRWIVNISNFFPGKGQQHMVNVLNQLPNPENYVYIQISSDTEFSVSEKLENDWKKDVATKLHKSLPMIYKKNIPRNEVIGYLRQANVFALTSEKEVAPLSILESMAASVPWVSADIGNTRELKGGRYITAIKNSRYHSVFDDRVCKLFARALQEMLDIPLIGEDGRQQIEQTMIWDKILPHYASIIEQ